MDMEPVSERQISSIFVHIKKSSKNESVKQFLRRKGGSVAPGPVANSDQGTNFAPSPPNVTDESVVRSCQVRKFSKNWKNSTA